MTGQSVTARRMWIALGCVVALAAGIGLAYWQWIRFESAGGTLQNFGYVLQWPLFGVFPAFMVWRIYHLARSGGDDSGAGGVEAAEPEPNTGPSRMAYVPPTEDDVTDDPALARYNRMLADIAAEDEANQPTKERT